MFFFKHKIYKRKFYFIYMKKIFLGAPGAGKGTAASRIAPIKNIPHISTGDLFRNNLKNNTEVGLKAKEFMDKGELVPDEVVIEMVKERMTEPDCENGFILDGFPRTLKQAEMLKEILPIDAVINIDVPDEIVIQRLCSRITCKDCGKIFNLTSLPPKQEGICDSCEGELYQRDDDKEEVIQNRLSIYKEQTQPLIDFYKNLGLISEVKVTNPDQTPEELVEKVLNSIEGFNKELKENSVL